VEASEVKVEGSTTVEGYRGRVKYPSGQFNGITHRKGGRSREREKKKIKCSRERERERERERTVCSLDRIIAGGSELTSSRITSTSPYLELYSLSCCTSLHCSGFLFCSLRLLLLFMRCDELRMIIHNCQKPSNIFYIF